MTRPARDAVTAPYAVAARNRTLRFRDRDPDSVRP